MLILDWGWNYIILDGRLGMIGLGLFRLDGGSFRWSQVSDGIGGYKRFDRFRLWGRMLFLLEFRGYGRGYLRNGWVIKEK